MDLYGTLFSRYVGGGGGGGTPEETVTYEGVPPLDVTSNGKAATAYEISGDMGGFDNPAPDNPQYPDEVGYLVDDGEHAGSYAIPVAFGEAITNIYLDEPLRKIGDYSDKLSSDGTVTRRIKKVVLNGTENWSLTSGMFKLPFGVGLVYLRELILISACSHYTAVANQSQAQLQDHQMTFLVSGSGTNNLYIKDNTYADAAAFKEFLAAQYAAETPVTIWYIMAENETSSFTAPTLTPPKGTSSFGIYETTRQASNISLTCTIGGGGGGGGSTSASNVSYDNSSSGLTATKVQGAIDELAKTQGDRIWSLYCAGYEHDAGNLASGESITLDSTNCKKNNVFSFLAKITSFGSILVGQGFETYSGAWAEITDTKLIVHNYTNSDSTVEYTHGLTIADYIYVQIFVSVAKADIVIYSNGSTFKQQNANWFACNGAYFAKSVGSTLTDCVFTWSSPDFRKSVWVLGDSYVGLNNVARWATQLKNAGFADNVLFNGYAGEASAAAVTALTNALEHYGQPKMLVWCLGMNDGADSGTTPSANYKNGITQVETLCETYGIELIRATIPTVPGQNNEGKNAYVRASGGRYIDFAAAVGASASGVWYTGMLSNDNVHPSEAGAIALYHRAIADCPELTFTNP